MIKRMLRTREFILFCVVLLVFIILAIRVDGFFDAYNLLERTRYWAATGMIAVAMTFVIATGGIDLSVASILALCGILMGLLRRDAHWNMPAAVTIAQIPQ